MHHHHSFPHLSRKQMLLLYLARQRAEDPGPPSAWERFAAVIAGIASLVALVALGALAAFVLFALVLAFLT